MYIYEHMMPAILPTDGVVLLVNPTEVPAGVGFRLGAEYNFYDEEHLAPADEPHPVMKNMNPEQITVTKYTQITSYDGFEVALTCNADPLLLIKNEPE